MNENNIQRPQQHNQSIDNKRSEFKLRQLSQSSYTFYHALKHTHTLSVVTTTNNLTTRRSPVYALCGLRRYPQENETTTTNNKKP